LYSQIFENFVIPVFDLARGTSRYQDGKVLEKTQYFPIDQLREMQNMSLRALVKHAYETVPYYRRVFTERNLFPSDIKTTDDLSKLPILTKSDIRKNFSQLISTDFNSSRLVPYSTGGTGSPLKFYITRESMSWEVAAEYRAYSWGGYKRGDSCFLFWGSRSDLKANAARKLSYFVERKIMCDPFLLSDEALENVSKILRKFNPKVIRGYATSVYVLSKYLLKNDIRVNPKVVITGAELLSGFMRKTISEAFDCPVFDFYGSREIGAIASECEKHSGYHISSENVILEFIKNGEAVQSEEGQILLTNLRNYGMPFIRYQNGDVGTSSNDACSCGRGLPLMKALKGRTSQYLAKLDPKTGKVVPIEASVIMDHFMTFLKSPPESYRIVQEKLAQLELYVVSGKDYPKESISIIVKELQKLFGPNTKIDVNFVDALEPLKSGKRTPVISKINPFDIE
jgi:phenylacetate-CoA ligase